MTLSLSFLLACCTFLCSSERGNYPHVNVCVSIKTIKSETKVSWPHQSSMAAVTVQKLDEWQLIITLHVLIQSVASVLSKVIHLYLVQPPAPSFMFKGLVSLWRPSFLSFENIVLNLLLRNICKKKENPGFKKPESPFNSSNTCCEEHEAWSAGDVKRPVEILFQL